MGSNGVRGMTTEWSVTPFAVIQEIRPGKLILKRSQNSGTLTVTAKVSNGGKAIEKSVNILVVELGWWGMKLADGVDHNSGCRYSCRVA